MVVVTVSDRRIGKIRSRTGRPRGSVNTDDHRLTYTVEEAASMLGISISCAYDCIKRGQLPALRLGRRIVIPTGALDDLLTTAAPTASAPGLSPKRSVGLTG